MLTRIKRALDIFNIKKNCDLAYSKHSLRCE